MPHLGNGSAANMIYSGTQITGGRITTTATTQDGQQAKVDFYNAAQHERPSTPHTVVTAADGSQWYQVASGNGMGAFYATPAFTGDVSEAAQVAEAFPDAPEGTQLRQVDEGTMEATYGRSILNNSKTKIILNLEPDEAEYVKDVLKLTRTEIRSITQFERGEALISSNSNKVPVIIKASREEQQMITTDRAELEAMLNELKAVADVADLAQVPSETEKEMECSTAPVPADSPNKR